MNNVAYTSEYQDYRNKHNYIFTVEYLNNIETYKLSASITIKLYSYKDPTYKVFPYVVSCGFMDLYNNNELIYSMKVISDRAMFYNLIEHDDGKQYLLFRIDLYGYSVLDLSTFKDYHYIPEESFKGGETFIWLESKYNKNTNLLLIGGCYWASLYSFLVVDFSNPLNLPYPEYNLSELLDTEYDSEIDSAFWDNNNNLLFNYDDTNGESDAANYVPKTVDKEICIKKLRNG